MSDLEQREDGESISVSSETSVAETDRYGFLLGNGETQSHSSDDPCPQLVRHREMKWLSLINQWDQVVEKKHSKVKAKCQKGIPASVRAKCWPLLCGATHRKTQNDQLFKQLDSAPGQPGWIDVIKRDTDRQFPFHEMFLSKDGLGQQGLLRVLKAYTDFRPEEGYCQAQGPVAAVLLMNMPMEEAFWCLVQISELYLPGYYSPLLEGVLFDAAVLSGVIKKMCPAAYKHMQSQGVEPLMFATDWLMCLYSRHLPFNTLLRVWDLFFCYGARILFQVAVVLVRRCLGEARQRKECEGQMETLERLRAVRGRVQHEHADAFIQEVCSVPLSSSELQRLTDKEFEKWRKAKPGSTFDPRNRCHGYHMAWQKWREKENDKKERLKGNLSVPQVRSQSSHSPAFLRKKWRRRGSKVETEEWDSGGRRSSQSVQKEDSDDGEKRRKSVCSTAEEMTNYKERMVPELETQGCDPMQQVLAVEARSSSELSGHSEIVFEEEEHTDLAATSSENITQSDICRSEFQSPLDATKELQTETCSQETNVDTVIGQTQAEEELPNDGTNKQEQEKQMPVIKEKKQQTEELQTQTPQQEDESDSRRNKHEEETDSTTSKQEEETDNSGSKQEEEIENSGGKQEEEIHNSGGKQEEEIHNSGSKQEEEIHNSGSKQEEEIENSGGKQEEETDNSGSKQEEETDNSGSKQEEETDNSGSKQEEETDNSRSKQEEETDDSGSKQEEETDDSGSKQEEETGSKLKEETMGAISNQEEEMDSINSKQEEETASKTSKQEEETDSKTSKQEEETASKTSKQEEETEDIGSKTESKISNREEETYSTNGKQEAELESKTSTQEQEVQETEPQTESTDQLTDAEISAGSTEEKEIQVIICEQEEEGDANSSEQEIEVNVGNVQEYEKEQTCNTQEEDIQKDCSNQEEEKEEETKPDSYDLAELEQNSPALEKETEVETQFIGCKEEKENNGEEKKSSTQEAEIQDSCRKEGDEGQATDNDDGKCVPDTQEVHEDELQQRDVKQRCENQNEKEDQQSLETAEATEKEMEQHNHPSHVKSQKEKLLEEIEKKALSEEVEKGEKTTAVLDGSEGANGGAVVEQEKRKDEDGNGDNHTGEGATPTNVLTEKEPSGTESAQDESLENSRKDNITESEVKTMPDPETQSNNNLEYSPPADSEGLERSVFASPPPSSSTQPNPPITRSSGSNPHTPLRLRRSSSSRASYPTILSEDTFRDPHHDDKSQNSVSANANVPNADANQPKLDILKSKMQSHPTPAAQTDKPKRRGLFHRFRAETPSKSPVPKILIQDFSEGDEKLTSKERRRRRRERERREKEEEKERKKREKEVEKERERERKKPQTRGKSFQVMSRKNEEDDVAPVNSGSKPKVVKRHSVPYSESYF